MSVKTGRRPRIGKYGKVAIETTKRIRKHGSDPRKVWHKTYKKLFPEANDGHGCPLVAYLGLCEEGEINGVSRGSYILSARKLNKMYALEAVRLLRLCPYFESNKMKLWKKVLERSRPGEAVTHDYQVDVVLALWSEGFISISP